MVGTRGFEPLIGLRIIELLDRPHHGRTTEIPVEKAEIQNWLDRLVSEYANNGITTCLLGVPIQELSREELISVVFDLTRNMSKFEHHNNPDNPNFPHLAYPNHCFNCRYFSGQRNRWWSAPPFGPPRCTHNKASWVDFIEGGIKHKTCAEVRGEKEHCELFVEK